MLRKHWKHQKHCLAYLAAPKATVRQKMWKGVKEAGSGCFMMFWPKVDTRGQHFLTYQSTLHLNSGGLSVFWTLFQTNTWSLFRTDEWCQTFSWTQETTKARMFWILSCVSISGWKFQRSLKQNGDRFFLSNDLILLSEVSSQFKHITAFKTTFL